MGMFSVIGEVRSGYSPLESLVFDRVLIHVAGPLHAGALAGITPLLRPGMRVLDVGCGGGQFAQTLAERFPDLEIVGVDLSAEQVARATRRCAAWADRVSFVAGSALALPFADREFDLVYSVGSLEHWPDPQLGVSECVRVLRAGGPLFVMEGDRGCRQEDLRELARFWKLPRPLELLAGGLFRVVVVGESLDLADARAVADAVSELDGEVVRVPQLPAFAITGARRST